MFKICKVGSRRTNTVYSFSFNFFFIFKLLIFSDGISPSGSAEQFFRQFVLEYEKRKSILQYGLRHDEHVERVVFIYS